jgi:hypothetical protein
MSDLSHITDFKTMAEMVKNLNEGRKMLKYCDYIASLISKELKFLDSKDHNMLISVGKMQYDLDESGAFRSTTKIVMVEDINGNKYKITVEEA